MGKLRSNGLVRLIWPLAKPHLGKLISVFVLSMVGALLMQSTLLLLMPTWDVLFPSNAARHELNQAMETVPGITEEQRLGIHESLQRVREDKNLEEETYFARVKREAGEAVQNKIVGDPADLTPERRKSVLWRIAALVSLLALSAGIVTYIGTLIANKVSLIVVVALRQDLVTHLLGLSMSYHGRRKFGDLLSRMSADVGTTLTVLKIMLRDLVREPVTAVVTLGFAFAIAPLATLGVVLGLPLLLVPISILLRKMRKGSNRSLTQLGATTQAMTQIFSGIRTVKAYRAEERELERFQVVQQSYIKATMKMVRASALAAAWTITYTHVGMGLMIVMVGYMVIGGILDSSGGGMLAFFMLISASYKSIKRTMKSLGAVAEAEGACQRLQELVDEAPDIVQKPMATDLAGLGSGLKIENLGFTYAGEDTPALQGVNLELKPGETLALVGPSGSGKSTLIDLVARFLDPNEGSIQADGKDLRDLTLHSWTDQYSMVTQAPFLFHDSIEENIRYGKPEATAEEVRAACKAADIHEFIEALPEGYATNVADAGSRLSGGQRQRITIARAVLSGSPLLLLDEATSALDTESERAVQASLDNLMQGHTSIVIAHRLSTIRNADRIAVLEKGRLAEIGTHEELLAKEGLYAHLHSLQFQGTEA
ncbi:MAG: ABC transporter ATP-binding protein [Planctomycetota bacterium]|nr:ABC transporter ATP-binding protein [Planctomycetota bacterium]